MIAFSLSLSSKLIAKNLNSSKPAFEELEMTTNKHVHGTSGMKVIDKYLGEIEMVDSKHVLRVDQEELETVIPQIGGLVRMVNGAYRGSNARLLSVDTDNYCAKVRVEKGIYDGRVLQAVDYEDICKIIQ